MKINYKERKAISSEEQSQKEISYAVENAKLQLASDILATKSALESKKIELAEAKNKYPLDTTEIISISIDVEAFEDGLKRLEALKKEFDF